MARRTKSRSSTACRVCPPGAVEVVRRLGTEQTYNHMSAGWSWAFDTPFDWFKAERLRLGGINRPLVSWPARIKDKGALREQFIHVIDVVPTILEAAGLKAPEMVGGIKAPIEGTSFAYHLRPGQCQGSIADAVTRDDGPVGALRRRLAAQRKANRAPPWRRSARPTRIRSTIQVFELYNLGKDFNQTEDIAAQNPQKVKEMRAQEFLAEAKKHGAAFDTQVAARIVAPRPNITAGRNEFVYAGNDRTAPGRFAEHPQRLVYLYC